MKFNTKRTVLVGFAFLSICAFWQMYDNLVPKILTETFGIGESISGIIMAADNVLALFPYSAIFAFASFITMAFVKHGDNKVEGKNGLEAFDMDD